MHRRYDIMFSKNAIGIAYKEDALIFGKREKSTDVGIFTSSKCRDCKKTYQYRLVTFTLYIVVFFVNLIPLESRFECICSNCGKTESVDTKAAQEYLKKDFRKKKALIDLINFIKIAVAVAIVVAAIILPLTLIKDYGPDPEFLKSLVSEQDGVYNVENKNGDLLATVSVTGGKKSLTFLDRVSQLVGEPGVDGTFYMHMYYQEATDSSNKNTILVRIPDDPGILSDKYDVPVRLYTYNFSSDSLGYTWGIEDLSKIQYTPDKVIYNFSNYSSKQKENDTVILYLKDNLRLTLSFIPSVSGGEADQFSSLEVQSYADGRLIKDTNYYFDSNLLSLAESSGLSKNSTSDELLSFIDKNKPDPLAVKEYNYYKDTKVLSSVNFSMLDTSGTMQPYTQSYDITENKGYYIQKAAENSASSKP